MSESALPPPQASTSPKKWTSDEMIQFFYPTITYKSYSRRQFEEVECPVVFSPSNNLDDRQNLTFHKSGLVSIYINHRGWELTPPIVAIVTCYINVMNVWKKMNASSSRVITFRERVMKQYPKNEHVIPNIHSMVVYYDMADVHAASASSKSLSDDDILVAVMEYLTKDYEVPEDQDGQEEEDEDNDCYVSQSSKKEEMSSSSSSSSSSKKNQIKMPPLIELVDDMRYGENDVFTLFCINSKSYDVARNIKRLVKNEAGGALISTVKNNNLSDLSPIKDMVGTMMMVFQTNESVDDEQQLEDEEEMEGEEIEGEEEVEDN